MAKRKILMDDTRRELSKHGTETFPMTVSHDDLWAFEGKTVPIHWHDDLEINLLREGMACLLYTSTGETKQFLRFLIRKNHRYYRKNLNKT